MCHKKSTPGANTISKVGNRKKKSSVTRQIKLQYS